MRVQLVPTFYSHCSLFELYLTLDSEGECVQFVPKYHSEVKLRSAQLAISKYLSEIMRLLQNGGSGINLAKNSN